MVRMKCISNNTYEDCLTVGKEYDVRQEYVGNGIMKHVVDDNGEWLNTMMELFIITPIEVDIMNKTKEDRKATLELVKMYLNDTVLSWLEEDISKEQSAQADLAKDVIDLTKRISDGVYDEAITKLISGKEIDSIDW